MPACQAVCVCVGTEPSPEAPPSRAPWLVCRCEDSDPMNQEGY